jgi:hypothetical protein
VTTIDTLCSLYSDARDTIGVARPIRDILEGIRSGEWSDNVERYRAMIDYGADVAVTDACKRSTPAAAFAGVFSRRGSAHIEARSGLIVLDFDDLENPSEARRSVQDSEHILAAFLSVSGRGLKVLVCVDTSHPHADCYRAAERHLRETYGLDADPSGKDLARLCFLSHDPDIYLRHSPAVPLAGEAAQVVQSDYAPKHATRGVGDLSPGDDYDARGDFAALLRAHGWKPAHGDGNWTRPGKESGISATYGKVRGNDGGPRFFIFSTSVQGLRANHTYRPWQVYAELEHGGDYSAAATALARSGYGTARPSHRPSDYDAPSQEYPQVIEDGIQTADTMMRIEIPPIRTIEEEDALEIAPPIPLVDGLIHRGGVANLSGPSKARKTWAMMHLGLSVASGTPWLGWRCSQMPVLYLDLELMPYHFRQRRQEISKAVTSQRNVPFFSWSLRGVCPTLGQLREQMVAVCQSEGIGLIVCDPFYMLTSGDENKAEDMREAIRAFQSLALESGAALLYSHHFAKGNQAEKNAMDRASGSGVHARGCDTLMVMTPHEEEEHIVLECVARGFPSPSPRVLRWAHPLWEIAPGMDATALRVPGRKPKRQSSTPDRVSVPEKITDALMADAVGEFGPVSTANLALYRQRFRCADVTVWRAWKRHKSMVEDMQKGL